MLAETIVTRWNKNPLRGEFGIDMGVDTRGKLWIIEANTLPAIYLFKGLKDKTIYRDCIRTKLAFERYLRRKRAVQGITGPPRAGLFDCNLLNNRQNIFGISQLFKDSNVI